MHSRIVQLWSCIFIEFLRCRSEANLTEDLVKVHAPQVRTRAVRRWENEPPRPRSLKFSTLQNNGRDVSRGEKRFRPKVDHAIT